MAAAIVVIGCVVAAMAFACWHDSHHWHNEFARIKRDVAALKASQSPPAGKPPTVDDLYPRKDQPCSEPNTA